MNFAVLQFPGSNCDQDVVHVLRNVLGHSARLLWHKEHSLGDADAVIVPGGFSYGDYLRTGAIARFSPVMQAVQQFAANGGLVLGICNGFQILCEAGLLPGRADPQPLAPVPLRARLPEDGHRRFAVHEPDSAGQTAARARSPTAKAAILPTRTRWRELKANNQILWRYVRCPGRGRPSAPIPNGSLENIAGVCNERRNVAGLMPHPERASEADPGRRRRAA